ncbi:TonB-dependent receptor [Qipengyuania sp. 6B39]|uniref:TonB-dependent receptor n=1 Tax=Qipengyuania proteolytica TaxID=2867239 RepID=UPI001C896C21|nr:TonB-dependent receptor [Qipengyuania proteolytica]MBX7495278.1 TonB-dependent receptor [Qipengyuania proteolytica]
MAFRKSLAGGISTGAITIALAAFASPALAQDATIEPGQDDSAAEEAAPENVIVVEGYRQSLETAVGLKRNTTVIAEAFSSEDIGKLPDVSIAETLGRLPGLAVQRVDGRAQSLSVRGLGPDYSNSLLNGRQLVSSGDNRAVEYDQYPAELIDQGVIYKVPYAGLIGQGLAGTVDLRTIRPLAKGERIVSLSGRLEFNEDGSLNPDVDGWGYRATGTYVDQFADDTLGVALGVAYQSSPSQVEKFNAWGYPNDSGQTVLGGMKPFAKSVDLDRLGVFGTIEWQPTPEWSGTLDVFYADYRERIPMRGIEFPLNPGWGSGANIDSTSGGDFPDTVTFSNVQPVVRNDYDRKDVETFAIGYNAQYETDDVLIMADVAYSRADRRLQQIESYSGLNFRAQTGPGFNVGDVVTYTRNTGGFPFLFTNQIDYSDTDLIQLTDPRGWGADGIVQAGFINDTETEDELWTMRGEVVGKVDHSLVKSLVAGIAFDHRTKSRDITQNFLSLAGNGTPYADQGAVTRAPIPGDALLDPIASLGFLGFGPQVAYNPFTLISNGTYILTDVQSSSLPYPGDWSVTEDVYTGYLRMDLDTMLGSIPVTGNIGVQAVFTDQSSNGFSSNGGIGARLIPVTDGDSYSHFLPSMTLNFEVAPDMKLRFGAARTLARPRMDQLNASYSAGVSNQIDVVTGSIFSGGGGNPKLRPYVAEGVDVSYEWYFGGAGYIAIAGYYKWLSDFVNSNATVVRDFSYLRDSLTPQQRAIADATTYLGLVGGPDNGAEGHIAGIEASLSLPFSTFTSGFLSGFGFQTSASYTDSKLTITPQEADPFETDVPGLSKWVVNSTVYYENSGFEARLSHRYRSEFLAEFPGISASRGFRFAYPESIFDAQIGYRFADGTSLEGLSITLQALNLTDEPFINYTDGDRTHIIDYEEYGRTYLVGASYKF